MKCSNPKCKKRGELKTKRTIAEGRKVKRERYCPECQWRGYTTEIFSEDLEDERRRNRYKEKELTILANQKREELNDLKDHIQQILRICGLPGKK